MSFKHSLPSINALVTLEAATRLGSFTAAARELNVSQAAVSRQVRLLEEEFGLDLFRRSHRKVEPTSAGSALGTALNQALETVRDAVETLRHNSEAQTVTVGATLAFSHFWLLPKLSHFREMRPDLRIRIVSQDECLDLKGGELDVLIRFGTAPFHDGAVVASSPEQLFPVCSPTLVAGTNAPLSPLDVVSFPLIGTDGFDAFWISWSEWFARSGLGRRVPRVSLQFNHYTDSIAAAVAGQGVALGWGRIVADLLASGQLVRLGEKVDVPGTYNVLIPRQKPLAPAADAFVSWIAGAFAVAPAAGEP